MCGIVGYIGKNEAIPILLEGLRRLEYRGYDSAGVAVLGNHLAVVRASGKLRMLEEKLKENSPAGTIGIAHTRWATHGVPSEANAHPHRDCRDEIALVHNGIIENYTELRAILIHLGHVFKSETDTEVLAHLIEHEYQVEHDFLKAVRSALAKVRGTYGIAVASAHLPDTIIAARMGSPLVLGVGNRECFIASDPSALVAYTRKVVYLDDGEVAVMSLDGYAIQALDASPVNKSVETIPWDVEEIQKKGFPHFMLKEMVEQPEVVRNTLRGRLLPEEGTAVLGGLRDVRDRLAGINRLHIVACGSAYYAGLVGEYMIEEYACVPVEVDLASEFRYRNPVLTKETAVLVISQSGETADTLAAVREAKMKGMLTLGLVNVVGSTISRETDAGVYNHAGPEISVASTKVFLSQLTALGLLTLFLGRQRRMSLVMGRRIADELAALPELLSRVLESREYIETIGKKYSAFKNFLFLGRKYCAPIAYEGALKMKEITYNHAEGYAAGEMKHGPIALIDETVPSVVLAPVGSVYEKTKSNLEEIRARRGPVIAITTEGNTDLNRLVDDIIFIPKTLEMLTPILAVVPLQLLAYSIAIHRNLDPDQPRNVAKSVTVE